MPIMIAGVVLVVVLGGYWFMRQDDSAIKITPVVPEAPAARTDTTATNPTPEATTDTPTETPVIPTTDTEIAAAISGTFTQNTTYFTPKRTSHTLDISLTVESDVVTAATVRYDGKASGFSNTYQERFDAAYKTEVIGKKLSEISLSRVGGASLTSESFNEAVKQVQNGSAS